MRITRFSSDAAAVVLLRIIGTVLLVVAIIHFAVTPALLKSLFGGQARFVALRVARASFLLNHLVVGVLLVPAGLSTIFAAGGIARGDRLARRIGWANALAVLSLPAMIAAVMGRTEILSGGPFTIAVALVAFAAITLVAAMVLTGRKATMKSVAAASRD